MGWVAELLGCWVAGLVGQGWGGLLGCWVPGLVGQGIPFCQAVRWGGLLGCWAAGLVGQGMPFSQAVDWDTILCSEREGVTQSLLMTWCRKSTARALLIPPPHRAATKPPRSQLGGPSRRPWPSSPAPTPASGAYHHHRFPAV